MLRVDFVCRLCHGNAKYLSCGFCTALRPVFDHHRLFLAALHTRDHGATIVRHMLRRFFSCCTVWFSRYIGAIFQRITFLPQRVVFWNVYLCTLHFRCPLMSFARLVSESQFSDIAFSLSTAECLLVEFSHTTLLWHRNRLWCPLPLAHWCVVISDVHCLQCLIQVGSLSFLPLGGIRSFLWFWFVTFVIKVAVKFTAQVCSTLVQFVHS